MDRTQEYLAAFFVAAALGTFALALNDAREDLITPPEPPAQEQQMEKQDNVSAPAKAAPLPSAP